MTSMAMGTVQRTGSQENRPVWTTQAPGPAEEPEVEEDGQVAEGPGLEERVEGAYGQADRADDEEGRPVTAAMKRPEAVPRAKRTAAPRKACLSVSQPRTTAPLTGVTSRSRPRRKSKTSLSMLAAPWRTTMVARAQRKSRGEKRAPPMTTARAVPKTTGMVEAGNDQGRAAISHFRGVDGTAGEGTAALFMAPVLYVALPPASTEGGAGL